MLASHHRFSIKAFQEGDPGAFAFIFTCYYPSLCYFANRLIPGKSMAEDITQDAFVRLWQKHEAFGCQQAIKAFLYIIIRNACLNFIKYWQRRKNNEEIWAFTWDETEDHVLNKLSGSDVFNDIHAAIDSLPTECRKIILLSYMEGFRNQEIAQKLNLSIHTVKNQKLRGLYLLKKRLLPC